MDRLISEDKVIRAIYAEHDRAGTLRGYLDAIKAIPSAEPKTGHWLKTPKAVMGEGYLWYCDKCGNLVYQDSSRTYPSEKYCSNCGCRMILPFA